MPISRRRNVSFQGIPCAACRNTTNTSIPSISRLRCLKISLNQPDATFLTSASFWTFEIKGFMRLPLALHASQEQCKLRLCVHKTRLQVSVV